MGWAADVEINEWQAFSIDDNYKWVLFVTMLIVVSYFGALAAGGGPRSELFPQEWMTVRFG